MSKILFNLLIDVETSKVKSKAEPLGICSQLTIKEEC